MRNITLKNKILPLAFAFGCVLAISGPKKSFVQVQAAEVSSAVAQVGNIKYDNYMSAWNQVSDGGTITLLQDWTTSKRLVVKEDASVTINMNGHMINRNLHKETDEGNIFLVEDDATLNINGNNVNSTVHYGNIIHDKWTYQSSTSGNIPIYGALLTGGYSDDGGGAIKILDEANVTLNNVNVVGNASGDGEYGGAIYLEEDDASLNILNSNISYNLINDGYGGALYSEGDNTIYIDESSINHNVATESSDGGAFYIEEGRLLIFESEILYNKAGRRGGAIYTYDGYTYVGYNSVIGYNYADSEGGGVYVDDDSFVQLSGKMIGNSARDEGGAIYVNANVDSDEGLLLYDIEIMGNSALLNGGGVYVDSDDDIALNNKVQIYSNSPNNLYIQDEEAIYQNNLTNGANVGIYTSWNADEENPVETSNSQYFFSDKMGKTIARCEDGFYFKNSAAPSTTEYKVGNYTYPIIEDVFRYSYDYENSYLDNFFYSDGYFVSKPKYYNEHLSTFAIALTLATMASDYEDDYDNQSSRNAVDMLEKIDFKNIYLHYPHPDYYGVDHEDVSTIGYVIASKETVIDGKATTLVITSIRGGTYFSEWASNFTMGDGNEEHAGFNAAKKIVKQGVDQYIKNNSINANNVKFLVTGYSRSAAVANLLSKDLTDIYGEDRVYGYCFATPKGGVESKMKDGCLYTNIHNVLNKADLVTQVGTTEMGFIRYGIDHYVPGYLVGTDGYEEQKTIMLNHLHLFNPNIEYDDYFHEATLEYIASTIDVFNIIFDLIDENYFTEHDYAEHWSPYCVSKLQEYSFNDMLSNVSLSDMDTSKEPYKSYTRNNVYNRDSNNFLGYRNFYSNYKWYIYLDEDGIKNASYDVQPTDYSSGKYTTLTLEKALTNFVDFYYSASPEKIEKLMGSLDVNKIMERISMSNIYFDIIREWNELNIGQRNKEFNNLWAQIGVEAELKKVLTDEEMHMMKTSLYVIFDFLLDFVSEDYDETDQDVLGTLIYNISNIFNTHTSDVAYSWVKSYDSFYTNPSFKCSHSVQTSTVLQEASETEEGVKEITCLLCGSHSYEAIEKLGTSNTDKGVASLIGTGSIISITCMSLALIGAGVSIFFYVKTKKLKKE